MRNIWILFSVEILTAANCANLLNNGEFEDETAWKLQVRKNLWDLNPAEPEQITVGWDCGDCRDNRAMHFETLGPNRELVASQYIPEERVFSSEVGKLARIKIIANHLRSRASYHVCLDISYDDGKYLFVNHEVFCRSSPRTCLLVPQYGVVRAMFLHLVVTKLEEPLTIDDVSVETIADIKGHSASCEAFLASKPKHREVLLNHLQPQFQLESPKIDLVTQLTTDRLGFLEETAAIWKGRITAALLLYQDEKEEMLGKVTKFYRTAKYLSRFATIHVVMEDSIMRQDATAYPVNFLRKFILNATDAEYVFYVDADITPTFSHDTAVKWLQQEAAHLTHEQSAFVAPVFLPKGETTFPLTKKDLLKSIEASRFGPFSTVSHSAVNYGKWYNSDHVYEMPYGLNMEPYFITHREAPLINEMFEGYGRDKCAYSKELHHAGFSFHVLPEAFLINRREPPTSSTILQRSGSVHLRVFLTTMFHDEDLRQGFIRRRETSAVASKPRAEFCDPMTGRCDPEHETENLYTREANIDMEQFLDHATTNDEEDGGLSCDQLQEAAVDGELHPYMLRPFPHLVADANIVALTVERVIKLFQIGNLVYLPKRLPPAINLVVAYFHPSNVINVIPNSPKITFHPDKSDLFSEYKSFFNSTGALLRRVRTAVAEPCIFWMGAAHGLQLPEAEGNLSAALEYSTNDDVIVVEDTNALKPNVLMQAMCKVKKSWKLYKNEQYYIMKSSHFKPPHPIFPPSLDLSSLEILDDGTLSLEKCPPLKTDIVLFTKNRPLHSHAFVESLLQMVSGINKLWIIAHSDSADMSLGYDKLVGCFSHKVPIEIFYDNDDGFGRTFDRVLHQSEADFVVINVDEMIWLRPVDLGAAACLLHTLGDNQVASFQLRLGDNLRLGPNFDEGRSVPIAHIGKEEIRAFYPLWQPYDYGYVTHTDAPLLSLRRLHRETGPWLYEITNPGALESRWLRRFLHKHARTWHLSFSKTRLVNNKLGERVTGTKGLEPSTVRLLKVYLEHHQAIEIERFRAEHSDHPHTHHQYDVQFKDIKCP